MNSPDNTRLYPTEPVPVFPGRIAEPLRNALSGKQARASFYKLITAAARHLGLYKHALVGLGLGFLGAAAFSLALPFLACLPYLIR